MNESNFIQDSKQRKMSHILAFREKYKGQFSLSDLLEVRQRERNRRMQHYEIIKALMDTSALTAAFYLGKDGRPEEGCDNVLDIIMNEDIEKFIHINHLKELETYRTPKEMQDLREALISCNVTIREDSDDEFKRGIQGLLKLARKNGYHGISPVDCSNVILARKIDAHLVVSDTELQTFITKENLLPGHMYLFRNDRIV